MFKTTLRKLTIVNSIVFLLIFVVFGSILYTYIAFRLFDQIDDAMLIKAQSIRIVMGRASLIRSRSLIDPRTFLLLRDTTGKIININPVFEEEVTSIREVVSKVNPGEIKTKKVDNHTYHILSVPYEGEEKNYKVNNGMAIIKEVIAVSNVDYEISILRKLLVMIIFGVVSGLGISILAGYYLAKRAMIPIQTAWLMQQQFVADASHELRSPLAVIRSNAELLFRHPNRTVEQEGSRISNIIRESLRMTNLISCLLTLARADANQEEVFMSLINIDEVVQTVTTEFMPLANLNGINLTVQTDGDFMIMADKERLHQLLVILLDNAIKYTVSGDRILVACNKLQEDAILYVEDTGCGISAEDLPRIFDRFYRGDKARSRNKGGTGLGLAIAKWIVQKHGGNIFAESRLGQGSKITVVIPLGKIKE